MTAAHINQIGSFLLFCTEKNGKEFVVSDLLDFSADDSSAFLKDALVVPERIELLQCVGCVFTHHINERNIILGSSSLSLKLNTDSIVFANPHGVNDGQLGLLVDTAVT